MSYVVFCTLCIFSNHFLAETFCYLLALLFALCVCLLYDLREWMSWIIVQPLLAPVFFIWIWMSSAGQSTAQPFLLVSVENWWWQNTGPTHGQCLFEWHWCVILQPLKKTKHVDTSFFRVLTKRNNQIRK